MGREFTIKLTETNYDNGNHLVTARLYNAKDKELKASAVSRMNNESYSFKQSTKSAVNLLLSQDIFSDDIEEGDYVKVIDSGKLYITHTEWVGNYIDSELAAHFVYNHDIPKESLNSKFKVLKRVDNKLYIGQVVNFYSSMIRDCYLIHVDGVEKIYE